MEFTIPEEAKMLQMTMRKFVEEECFPVEQEMMRIDPDWIELPQETFNRLRTKLRQLGFWALDVPVEYEGQGLDTLGYCLITEEQYKTVVGTVHYSPFWGPISVMLFPALYRGSSNQKENYLFPLIRGEKRAGLC